jgi:hypothetical protein
MTEPFGIAAGAVGIAATFTACVDCFGYVQLGRHFGRDFQTDLLTLNCARLRLTRWGQAVNIYEDPKLGKPDVTSAEVRTVKDTLYQILILFASTRRSQRSINSTRRPETTFRSKHQSLVSDTPPLFTFFLPPSPFSYDRFFIKILLKCLSYLKQTRLSPP